MQQYTLQNDTLIIEVKEKGAELSRVFNKKTNLEYIWNADPAFWGKSSPVLFPIVGALKDNQYTYNGNTYTMSKHGFARDKKFNLISQTENELTFSLREDLETLEKYPFQFELRLVYTLEEDTLSVRYEVYNPAEDNLYFSIGAHPAFTVPLTADVPYESYRIVFDEPETQLRWPIDTQGLLATTGVPYLTDERIIALEKSLFYDDAIVFKHLKSKRLQINTMENRHGIDFDFTGFPYMGIWAAKNADFVCIEPWSGIADHVDHNEDYTTKEGVIKLSGNNAWTERWKVRFY
jgi:galactose mutarotase-like enzyme